MRALAGSAGVRAAAPVGLLLLLVAPGCRDSGPGDALSADTPLHLEEHLDRASIEGADVPSELDEPMVWSFAGEAAGWRPLPAVVPGSRPLLSEETETGLRLTLTEDAIAPATGDGRLHGGIFVEVPGWDVSRWSHVLIEARTTDPITYLDVAYSVRETPGEDPDEQWPLIYFADGTNVISDGEVQTYRLEAEPEEAPHEPIRELGIEVGSVDPASIEIRSVTWVPLDALYAETGVGVRSVAAAPATSFGRRRRTLFAHAPARLDYPIRVPAGGHLDVALAAHGAPLAMTIELAEAGGSPRLLVEEAIEPGGPWRQRSVDLSRWAGREIVLTLASDTAAGRGVALWGSPTVSGREIASRPNVILYVIDGASAGQMSLHGYNRRTTPHLEAIASEGVVFERAYSNSTWTTPSTASFMTSLHHSVLGAYHGKPLPIPDEAVTMAQRFHRAGYHTGVFTTNPNAGSLSGLERGVDAFRDHRAGEDAASSVALHEEFWRWRAAYPDGPYWVHFQTTDVHPPHHPPPPFAGLFVPAERRERFWNDFEQVEMPWNHDSASVHEHYREELERAEIDSHDFYDRMRGLHDEAMAHQDYQLGRLVERLRATGEWERTLLVVASDHGHPAASYPRFGRGLLDPQPPPWEGALLGAFSTHIPMVFVWPERIPGGRRIAAPVSMIDLLPTLLELAGLPAPEITQGRSLAPLLLGEPGWTPAPIVFDEFRIVPETGELLGNLELLGDRWGASLEIHTAAEGYVPATGRHPAPAGGRWSSHEFPDVPPLLLYDLWSDPLAIANVGEQHPDELERSRRELLELWKAHRALAERFEAGDDSALTPDQLESLRALGYIQ